MVDCPISILACWSQFVAKSGDKGGERERDIYIYIYIHTHTYIYIYTVYTNQKPTGKHLLQVSSQLFSVHTWHPCTLKGNSCHSRGKWHDEFIAMTERYQNSLVSYVHVSICLRKWNTSNYISYLSIYLSSYLSIYLAIYLSFYLSIYLMACYDILWPL